MARIYISSNSEQGGICMFKIIFLSASISFVISFFMMKLQMKMIEKWMDKFFQEEKNFIKNNLIQHKDR